MKVVICGNYGAKNIGDELILEGIINLIRDIKKNSKITVLSESPQRTKKKFRVKACPKVPSGLRSIVKSVFKRENKAKTAIKNCDNFILGGGGLFAGPSKRANIIWAIQAITALKYKKPLIILGQSIGDNAGPLTRLIIKHVFNKAAYISVRDDYSKKILKKWGITRKINRIPDLAFMVKRPKIKQKRDQKTVLLALTKVNIQSISPFLRHLVEEHGYKLNYINFQEGSGSDEKTHKSFDLPIKKIKQPKDSQELLKIFQKAEFLIGMRLHSIITSIMSDTPFIGISYAKKVKEFAKYAELNDLVIDQKNLSPNILKQYLSQMEKNKSAYINKMKTFNRVSEAKFEKLKKVLKENDRLAFL